MALDSNIRGSVSGLGAEVNASNQLKVVLETDIITSPGNVGAVRIISENDAGTITATPYLRAPETSADYRLRVGMDTVQFSDTFNSNTQNSNLWHYTNTTLTCTQPGLGTLNFGTVPGTAATHGAIMRTNQYFPLIGTAPMALIVTAGMFTANLVTDEHFLMGFGNPGAANTPPTDGVWFRINSVGLYGEVSYNGSLISTGLLLPISAFTLANFNRFLIVVDESEVEFWMDDILLQDFKIPGTLGQPFMSQSQPAFLQKYCTGAVTSTNTMRVSDVTASLMDVSANKPWAHQLATAGNSVNVIQNGTAIPTTGAKTTLWVNSTAPTATVLTNTTASFIGLGGIASILPTLAVGTDGIVFSYQNPAGTTALSGRNLVVCGVTIEGCVSVALAGGPVAYVWAIAYGHTAISLATAQTASFATAATRAPIITPIGFGSFPVTAAVGTTGSGCQINLTTPIIVRPGEYIQLIARNVGVVTTAGAITVVASFDGYWE